MRYDPKSKEIEVVIMDGTESYEFEFDPALTIEFIDCLSDHYIQYLEGD